MIYFDKLWKTLKKNNRNIKEVEYSKIDLRDYLIIDVRSRREFNENHLSGSVNIPLSELNKKIETSVKNKNTKILVCCLSGIRSKKAAEILHKLGYTQVYNLKKGLQNL